MTTTIKITQVFYAIILSLPTLDFFSRPCKEDDETNTYTI